MNGKTMQELIIDLEAVNYELGYADAAKLPVELGIERRERIRGVIAALSANPKDTSMVQQLVDALALQMDDPEGEDYWPARDKAESALSAGLAYLQECQICVPPVMNEPEAAPDDTIERRLDF